MGFWDLHPGTVHAAQIKFEQTSNRNSPFVGLVRFVIYFADGATNIVTDRDAKVAGYVSPVGYMAFEAARTPNLDAFILKTHQADTAKFASDLYQIANFIYDIPTQTWHEIMNRVWLTT